MKFFFVCQPGTTPYSIRNFFETITKYNIILQYGWLASKPKFQLEIYGPYMPQYPDPMKDTVTLSGDIPLLAVGKGFIW